MSVRAIPPPGSMETSDPDTARATERSKRPLGARRWWLIGVLSVSMGVVAGVLLTNVFVPSSVRTTSSQVFTSTGGTFTRDSGQPAVSFEVPGLRQPASHVSLAQFRGKPLVLNFWASWCPPCRQEMPSLQSVALAERGHVNFVGVDVNDQRGAALAFLRLTGVSYPVGSDPRGKLAATYGVYGLPTTFFISANGRLLGHQIGGLTRTRLTQLLSQVFGATR